MVSDQEIANGVASLLRQSDPNAFTTFNSVVQHLETKLGLDLTHKAGFIRNQIEFLIRSSHAHQTSSPHPPPPPPPVPVPVPASSPQPTKDHHFALQQQQQQQHQHQHHHHQQQHQHQHPQFQNTHQIPSHFALQHQHQLQHQQQYQRHHEELNFQCPPPQPQQQQQQQQQQQLQIPHPQQQHSRAHPKSKKGVTKDGAIVKRRGGPGGLTKVCGVSPELQAIVGEPTMPRTQIVKQLWAYIRKNNLQDPSNKRKIICNDELRLVFEVDSTDMFKMNKLLAKHIIALEPSKEPTKKKRVKVEAESASESQSTTTEVDPALVIISDALAKFFGTGEREMLQTEALRRVWEYIQVNHLEDPLNSTVIICDEKLQELFGCESISALGVSEMVGHHFFKRS